jgi:hypothetical protein
LDGPIIAMLALASVVLGSDSQFTQIAHIVPHRRADYPTG